MAKGFEEGPKPESPKSYKECYGEEYFTFTLELDTRYKTMNKERIIISIRRYMQKARIRLDKPGCVVGEVM